MANSELENFEKKKKGVRIRNNQEYHYIEPFLAGRTYLNNLEYMKELAS